MNTFSYSFDNLNDIAFFISFSGERVAYLSYTNLKVPKCGSNGVVTHCSSSFLLNISTKSTIPLMRMRMKMRMGMGMKMLRMMAMTAMISYYVEQLRK